MNDDLLTALTDKLRETAKGHARPSHGLDARRRLAGTSNTFDDGVRVAREGAQRFREALKGERSK